jgi:hypothetical protein
MFRLLLSGDALELGSMVNFNLSRGERILRFGMHPKDEVQIANVGQVFCSHATVSSGWNTPTGASFWHILCRVDFDLRSPRTPQPFPRKCSHWWGRN